MRREQHLVVRFRKGHGLARHDEPAACIDELGLGAWSELAERIPDAAIEPAISNVTPDDWAVFESRADARSGHYVLPDFTAFYRIDVPEDTDVEKLVDEVGGWEGVESAYWDRGSVGAAQGYLGPSTASKAGVDAYYAWGLDAPGGGTGAGSGYALVDGGWAAHDDLPNVVHLNPSPDIMSADDQKHGTMSLGVVCAKPTNTGFGMSVTGIAHETKLHGVATTGVTYARYEAVLQALKYLEYGQVLHIGIQIPPVGGVGAPGIPIESAFLDWLAIRLATALGIVVCEPAGQYIPAGVEFEDDDGLDLADVLVHGYSGAIIVGAGSPTQSNRVPDRRANYGHRVDVWAWATGVETTSPGGSADFDGTSAATAIIAGVCAAIQGVVIARSPTGSPLSGRQMRRLLRKPQSGTQYSDLADGDEVMPDLEKILAETSPLLAFPNVVIRDSVYDDSSAPAAHTSRSPDIIVDLASILDRQAHAAYARTNEMNDMLGLSQVDATVDHVVHVRFRNRGPVPAAPSTVWVYRAPFSTFPSMDTWELIESVTLPVASPGPLFHLARIPWDAADAEDSDDPEPRDYTLIGVVGTPADPAPLIDVTHPVPPELHAAFFRRWNNVAVRSVSVVDLTAALAESDTVYRDFVVPAPRGIANRLSLELHTQLPEDAQVFVGSGPKLPNRDFRSRLGGGIATERAIGNDTLRIELPAIGVTTIPWPHVDPVVPSWNLWFQIMFAGPVPIGVYEVDARELLDGEELGRVTIRLRGDSLLTLPAHP